MNYVEEEILPGLLLIVDFKKAFDSISLEFIGKVFDFLKGSLTLAMGKRLWFSVKIKVCQSSLSSL